ncbi:alpha/beta hydrolase, partial [Rhizobium sp. Root651]|uniref:alpha/beta hydrolase n=1 Tax=Rhizobium sp. Root651 TaxID=1736577 RepID=UPI0009EB4B68
MLKLAATVVIATALLSDTAIAQPVKPTIVLVHGAFADSSSWNGVIINLQKDGYKTVAVANPLRSVSNDARLVSDVVGSIEGPVVLVGHSYGGQIISNAANGHNNVRSLVYVAAFAPDSGESASDLAGKFPGGTLGEALAAPVKLTDGGVDLYIDQTKFRNQFAHDVAPEASALMAVGQRPITEAALTDKSGEPAWKTLPSYFVYGDSAYSNETGQEFRSLTGRLFQRYTGRGSEAKPDGRKVSGSW